MTPFACSQAFGRGTDPGHELSVDLCGSNSRIGGSLQPEPTIPGNSGGTIAQYFPHAIEPIGITHAGYPNYRALKVTTCSIISGDKVPTIAVDPACREAIRQFDDTFAQAVADGIETASASGTQFRLHPYFDPPASDQDGQRKAA